MRHLAAVVLTIVAACGGGGGQASSGADGGGGSGNGGGITASQPDGGGGGDKDSGITPSQPDGGGGSTEAGGILGGGPDASASPAGIPTGLAITQVIGPAGGRIATPDGAFAVDVPAGALAAETTLSVQPITLTAPGGFGQAYRLGPDGQTFAQPVTLTFRLDGASALDFAVAAVATQPATGGAWTALPSQRDASMGTVVATTSHFTDYVIVSDVTLDPRAAQVDLGNSVFFTAAFCSIPRADSTVAPCTDAPAGAVAWTVDGAPGGNPTLGTVSGTAGHATFFAPTSAPAGGSVKVGVTVTNPDGTVAGATATVQIGPQASWGGSIDVVDVDTSSAGQTVTLKSHAEVSFRLNQGQGAYTPNGNITMTYDFVDTINACSGQASGGGSILDADGSLQIMGQTYLGFGTLMTPLPLTGTDDCTSDHSPEPLSVTEPLYAWWPMVPPTTGLGYALKNNGTELGEHITETAGATTYDVTWDLLAGQ